MPVIPEVGSTLHTSTFTFSRGAFDAAFFALDALHRPWRKPQGPSPCLGLMLGTSSLGS
jgi:hypothetical protein